MKAKKIVKRILMGLLAVVLVLLLALNVGVTVKYWDYFKNSDACYVIPGLGDDYVPQGYDYIAELDTYLMCGYMSDGTASRVYVRGGDGETHYSSLYYEDGTPYLKHAGGVTWFDQYVYLAGDTGIDVFLLEDILEGKDAVLQGVVELGHDTAYCSSYNGYLLIGNFYYGGHYETPEEHRITTPAGDENTALITVFRCDPEAEYGVDPTPVAAISTQEKVQGMCFTSDGEIVLSTSWSVGDSNLLYYTLDTDRVDSIEIQGTEVPLIYLDSANLTHTAVLPPMSEELVFRDGKVEVMCESACNKYIFGKLIRGFRVRAYEAP